MEGFIYPLEHRMHSWLLANNSRMTNKTYYPLFNPASSVQPEWSTQVEAFESFFNFAFQDISLGFLSLLVLQQSFRSLDTQYHPGHLLTGNWNLWFFYAILANILKTLIGVLLLLVLIPVVLPVVCIFWVMSSVVKIIYSVQFHCSVSKAIGMDGVWGLESKESRPFIITCLLLSGFPDIDKIRQHITAKVLNALDERGDYKFKKFRQTFSQLYGYYMWRDVDVLDIKNHVRMISLPVFYHQESRYSSENGQRLGLIEHGIKEETRKQLADSLLHRFLSEESVTALSGDRPPWEVLLLVRGDGRYNVVIRLHHAIGDGVALMRVCVETLVDTPLAFPSVGPPRMGNVFIRAAMMVWSTIMLPFGLLQVVANFDFNALHGCPLSGKKVIASSRGLPLSVIKSVKVAVGATVNDVLMSCLAAALSKHFARRSEDVGQVTAVVPVSFHDLNAPVALSNQFSVATLKLPTDQTHTPASRLKNTKTILDGMKRDPTLMAVFSVVKAVSDVLPAPVAEVLLTGRGVTLAASNVPGPQQEITVWGDKVEDLQFWVPNRAPVGVGFSFASYMGVVKIGLNVDAALVHSREEAQQLLDDIEGEMYTLYYQLVLSRQ